MQRATIFQLIFFTVGAIHLLSHLIDSVLLIQITKPLLMPSLLAYFYFSTIAKRVFTTVGTYAVACALGFSFIGDVALIYTRGFIWGLVAFLLAHVSYIVAFTYLQKFHIPLRNIVAKPVVWLLFTAGMLVYGVLFPYLGEMRSAVGLYVAIVVVMAISAYLLKQPITFVGALLFLFSDGYLAFNKFYVLLPLAGFVVMASYLMGQWLIVKGVISYIYDRRAQKTRV
ncbi:MAG: lysoplasmalogenase [Cytophagales bacterium]|nr:lysoplasmalogenase [Cytophagales bacterium]